MHWRVRYAMLIIAFNYLQNSGCLYDIIFSHMKKIYSLLLILSLVVGSLSSVVHANESNYPDDIDTRMMIDIDDNLQMEISDNAECHQCVHVYLSITLKKQLDYNFYLISSKYFASAREIYFSQSNSGIFQPPKA